MWYIRKGKNGSLQAQADRTEAMTNAENFSINSSWAYYVIHEFNHPDPTRWVIAKFSRGKKVPTPTVE
jgi:hypothetical protein